MAKPKKKPAPARPVAPNPTKSGSIQAWKFFVPVCAITFLLFLPALGNGFTNWDDILYVTGNELLKSLDMAGMKAIWSTPVVSNYHPLTIMSLALNYQLAGIEPMTYHLTSILLHTVNTGLVFAFIMLLSNRNAWVSAFVALVFGIHPMHVESVAWISERKDLLYTLFYLLALMQYVHYVRRDKILHMALATAFGALSLLSKPAAIVLPLSMLAVDYLLRRPWSMRLILEKAPLFILAAMFAWVTLDIQSGRAVASLGLYGITDRIAFAGFGFIWYLLKAIVPWPLSALHPFPESLNALYYLAPVLSLALVGFVAWRVRNRTIVFGLAFFLANLLLVLQLVSIGNAVVAERYTYVPYIGLFFAIGMEGYRWIQGKPYARALLGAAGIWLVALMVLTFLRIPVWKDSQTLWADVLTHYPDSKRAWTNKGLDHYDKKDWPAVVEHLTQALKTDPDYADALEWRSRAYMEMKEADKALADAERYNRLYPNREAGMFLYARALDQGYKPDQAIAAYDQLIARFPDNWHYYNSRGTLRFNKLQQYNEAKADFETAIRLNPSAGTAYLNLSRCYFMLHDQARAREMATEAARLGSPPDAGYAQLIGM